jgi:tetratricopeptide (TPR) repeat protein
MKFARFKPWQCAIIALIVAVSWLLLLERDSAAHFSWQLFHSPELSLAISSNALLALEIGNYYFNVDGEGEYNLRKAKHNFEHALLLDPLVPDAWHQLARISFLGGHFDDALREINTQIELHGESFMASYYIRGLIHGYRNEFSEAERDFRAFLEWDKENWAAYTDLAWVYFRAGEYQRALETTEKGLLFAPSNVWLLNMKGVTLLNLGRTLEAHSFFENALSEAEKLTEFDWERAYPGNDPRTRKRGLTEMRAAIQRNLILATE